jgi:hypothetical protein
MSRAIQVRISESVVRTVHVEDGVQSPLEMLPVLGAERMAELLAKELAALGFLRDGDTAKRTDPDGVEITVDLKGATVTVKIGAEERLAESVELEARTAVERQASVEKNLRDDALDLLDKRLTERTEELRREVTARLERKLGDIKQELDGAIGRATVGALTERAAQLGRIEEVHEDEAGNVTIRVKL